MRTLPFTLIALAFATIADAKPIIWHTVPENVMEDATMDDDELWQFETMVQTRQAEITDSKARREVLKTKKKQTKTSRRWAKKDIRKERKERRVAWRTGTREAQELATASLIDAHENFDAENWRLALMNTKLDANKLAIRASKARHSRAKARLERQESLVLQVNDQKGQRYYRSARFDRQVERIAQKVTKLDSKWQIQFDEVSELNDAVVTASN